MLQTHMTENTPTEVQFTGNFQVFPSDIASFVPLGTACKSPPYAEGTAAVVSLDLKITVSLPRGTHTLCLLQNNQIKTMEHVEVIVSSKPPVSPPPVPPPPSPPPPSPVPSPPPSPPPQIYLEILGGTSLPENDKEYEINVPHMVPTTLQFNGSHVVTPDEYVFFVRMGSVCGPPPHTEESSGFVDSKLQFTITLPTGSYYMCLRQNGVVTSHTHVKLIVMQEAPSPPPLPSPPNAPPPHITLVVSHRPYDEVTTVELHDDAPFTITIGGDHSAYPNELAYFTPNGTECNNLAQSPNVGGFIDSNHQITVKVIVSMP